MSTRLAIFDCDGTLVDSQRRIIAAVDASWRAQGLPRPDDEAIRRTVGLALPHALQALAPAASPALLALLVDGFRTAFLEFSHDAAFEEPLYPGVIAALEDLAAADIRLGVATGKGRRGLAKTLERHGLKGHFAILKTADDGPSKPSPHILNDAIAEMAASPETTVVLGDTAYDMAMARSAGAHALGVAWGYHPPEELTLHGAKAVLHRYDEVAPAVLTLIGKAR